MSTSVKKCSHLPRCATQTFFLSPFPLSTPGIISCACDHHAFPSYLHSVTSSALSTAPSHDLLLTTGGTNGNFWHSKVGIKCTDCTGCLHQSE